MARLASLAAFFLSLPALAANDPQAGAASATGSDVDYQYQSQAYEGYYVNAGKGAPLVLMVHDWDGLTAYEKQRAQMLAEMGYSVFALDLFGKGVRPTKMEDKRQHTGELYQNREKMRGIMQAGLASAKNQGADLGNAVVIGYCFGGAAVLELARSGQALQGFVTIHGGLGTPPGQDYKQAQGQYLIQHGGADSHVTLADFTGLVEHLERQSLPYTASVYGEAPHAWTVFGGDAYREPQDKKAWRDLTDFLQRVLKS